MNWTDELDKQLSWHWENHLRPRWDGLGDDEYLWEPVPGMWSVRPRGQGVAEIAAGSGDFIIDFTIPEPSPAPVTTIAWRIGHLLVGVFGARLAQHFGGPAVDYDSYDYPSTAADALGRIDSMYADWIAGVRSLDADGIAAAVRRVRLRAGSDGRAGAAHQPRGHPPRRGDFPAPRSVRLAALTRRYSVLGVSAGTFLRGACRLWRSRERLFRWLSVPWSTLEHVFD